jgi:virginiamycin B lyase
MRITKIFVLIAFFSCTLFILVTPTSVFALDSSITEFPVSRPGGQGIAAGPDGKIYYGYYGSFLIGQMSINGITNEFPTSGSNMYITGGADGNVWLTEGQKLTKVTPDGQVTELSVDNIGYDHTTWITSGPDGNIWFVGNGQIIKYVLNTGLFEYPISDSSIGPFTFDRDGNIWYVNGAPSKIVKVTPEGVVLDSYDFPVAAVDIWDMVTGPDGNIWFTERAVPNIGRITPDGVITQFPVPGETIQGPDGGNFNITVGPDGNLWFTGLMYNIIGVMTTSGEVIKTYDVGNVWPNGITKGLDGNIWFTEMHGTNLGRIKLNIPDTTSPILNLPGTITVNAISASGTNVSYNVTATDPDNQPSNLTISCSPLTGSTFPIGTTTVNCTASDPAGNTTTGSFHVVVVVDAPTSKDQCKKDGWQKYIYPSFKNQGDCVSYVATHGKNPPNGLN